MWEIIQANKRKSAILFVGMGACLILLGYSIGAAYAPPDGGIIGIFIACFIWIIMSFISYFGGDSIILKLSNAKEVTHEVHPQLFNIVEEMKLAANLPVMPKVYIIPEAAPNAFATGIRPERSAIAVTAGLLSKLNRDELQGVVAHEMSHIVNRDCLFMTFSGVLLGSIVLVSEAFLRNMWYSGGSAKRYRSGSSSRTSSSQAQGAILIVAVVFAILSPLIARLLYFAMSRKREYLADASSVRLTRYPEGLASALEKISNSTLDLASSNKITAPMYIVNPLKGEGMALENLTSTHPPISERIKILRSMQLGASYLNYQKAYMGIKGGKENILPASALKSQETIPLRQAFPEEKKEMDIKDKTRDIGDLIRAVNQYIFISCVCGLKIKVPPDFKEKKLSCPRCGKEHEVPIPELKEAAVIIGAATALGSGKVDVKKETTFLTDKPQVYKRKGSGWESFSCSCGRVLNLSPSFCGSHVVCSICSRSTIIQ